MVPLKTYAHDLGTPTSTVICFPDVLLAIVGNGLLTTLYGLKQFDSVLHLQFHIHVPNRERLSARHSPAILRMCTGGYRARAAIPQDMERLGCAFVIHTYRKEGQKWYGYSQTMTTFYISITWNEIETFRSVELAGPGAPHSFGTYPASLPGLGQVDGTSGRWWQCHDFLSRVHCGHDGLDLGCWHLRESANIQNRSWHFKLINF